jgi:hypothetical protein
VKAQRLVVVSGDAPWTPGQELEMLQPLGAGQRLILAALRSVYASKGRACTVREVALATGSDDAERVHATLLTLVEMGYLEHDPTRFVPRFRP